MRAQHGFTSSRKAGQFAFHGRSNPRQRLARLMHTCDARIDTHPPTPPTHISTLVHAQAVIMGKARLCKIERFTRLNVSSHSHGHTFPGSRYLLKLYYRTRLHKIERFAASILEDERISSRLCKHEVAHCQVRGRGWVHALNELVARGKAPGQRPLRVSPRLCKHEVAHYQEHGRGGRTP